MDRSRIDRISRLFTYRREVRRQATSGDPAASPAAPLPETATWEERSYLFVQSYQAGSLGPDDGSGHHTLTLEGGLGQTVYFSDRPGRDVGITPTPQFLETLGFPSENPPNAALVMETSSGETDLAVVELFDPVYDAATHTATYQVRGLEAWEDNLSLGLQDEPSGLTGVTPAFGTAHLFIDGCTDGPFACYHLLGPQGPIDFQGERRETLAPYCWSNDLGCLPCNWEINPPLCYSQFPDFCNGSTPCVGGKPQFG